MASASCQSKPHRPPVITGKTVASHFPVTRFHDHEQAPAVAASADEVQSMRTVQVSVRG